MGKWKEETDFWEFVLKKVWEKAVTMYRDLRLQWLLRNVK